MSDPSLRPPASPQHVLAWLAQAFPAQHFQSVQVLDHGWDNVAAIADTRWVFRFPRDGDYARLKERHALERLKGRVSVAIPRIEFWSEAPACMGYAMIQGEQLTPEALAGWDEAQRQALARDLAVFLWEFHQGLPLEEMRGLAGAKEEGWQGEREQLRQAALGLADEGLQRAALRAMDEVEAAAWGQPCASLHCDLHHENFVVDPATKRLAGVFDFGDVCWGDVHYEFQYLYRLDPRLLAGALAAYEGLSGLKLDLRRAQLCAWINELGDLSKMKPGSSAHTACLGYLRKLEQQEER